MSGGSDPVGWHPYPTTRHPVESTYNGRMQSKPFSNSLEQRIELPSVGMRLELGRMGLDAGYVAGLAGPIRRAWEEMAAIERGERVNTDEDRQVGHYWLRDPERAPTPELRRAIEEAQAQVARFGEEVHAGRIRGEKAAFTELVVIGIGGSSLGPRFVAHALGGASDRLRPHFLDNTDPDGMEALFSSLPLERTLVVVISKSGGTQETRNGMLEAEARYRRAGLDFARHAAAVTGAGSELDRRARSEGWLGVFPMWDWVGGRTSETSAVGLLPAALQGLDWRALLAGARDCDEVTRRRTDDPLANPAMAMALAWHHATHGRGEKDMVILPYKDRLALFSQYLQQLVMESLGKALDRRGNTVHQGIAVYGNKGSTDQHAYVQQLRDGVPNFFATFVGVLRDDTAMTGTAPPAAPPIEVEPDVRSGDYLHGFLLGTRRALYENGRASLTLWLDELSPHRLGALIALYERAVGYYGALVDVNAYHQPGVEAGKRAAQAVIGVQRKLVHALRIDGAPRTAEEWARAVGEGDEAETVYEVLEHLAANPDRGVVKHAGTDGRAARYSR